MRELTSWLSGAADPERFPYSPVLADFHRVGKHFAAKELLALLDQIRAHVTGPEAHSAVAARSAATRRLRDFLDVALDKWDGRYDYRSYLALCLLGLPDAADGPSSGTDDPGQSGTDPTATRRGRDLLFVRLIADALAFELSAGANATSLLPEQRPGPEVATKRYRLGVRASAAALARLGLAGTVDDPDPASAAAALHAVATAGHDPAGALDLRLSMLPVYVSHDEYLFLRVLQAYECLFAGLTDELRATITALSTGQARSAADRLAYAHDQLTAASPLFSLLATMQPDSFRTFRQYTEGASAIQSRSYKVMESLCRTPERPRLDSPAYRSVPEVRARVSAGQPSIDDAYRAAVRDGRLTGPGLDLVDRRMREFATAVLQWRRTHYRLAVRMLGSRPGTGYTEGTPYLAAVRSVPVFTTVAPDPDPSSATEPTGGSPE